MTRRLIGDAGVTFTRYYASYPVCCPARATFFTGQYAQNHGVRCLYPACGGGYGRLNQRDYLPVWLQDAGYVTSHIGKFLNGYGKERATADRPRGWTDWQGLIDHSTYRMWGYSFFENDHRVTYGKVMSRNPRLYQTDVVTNKAVRFIGERGGGERPFFLSVAYPRAASRVRLYAAANRAARARGAAAPRPLRAPADAEAAELQRARRLGQAVLPRPLQPLDQPAP